MTSLLTRTDELLTRVRDELADSPYQASLAELHGRLHQPLRVAIAGRVKAGKSTLLNALIAELLAPTDHRECTRIVTWYRDGTTYRVNALTHDHGMQPLRFDRDAKGLAVDLGSFAETDIAHLDVEWPSKSLAKMTLIDTPGIGSLSPELAERAGSFLESDNESRPADAVLYLMRHLHATDVRFLESFHDHVVGRPNAINSIGVLSRADEIGVARSDAMQSAARIAQRYSADPKLRRLCQEVLPVAGLLAATAMTLREEEFVVLRELAQIDRGVLLDALTSVDRFTANNSALGPIEQRVDLLHRLGLFGVRLSLTLITRGNTPSSQQLKQQLVEVSGLNRLRAALQNQFATRADVLRSRSVLLALRQTFAGDDHIPRSVLVDIERIMANTHEFTEIRLLNALRSGAIPMTTSDSTRAERLLGGHGNQIQVRLDADPNSDSTELLDGARRAHKYWQQVAENPLTVRPVVDAARTLTRTCEGLIVACGVAN